MGLLPNVPAELWRVDASGRSSGSVVARGPLVIMAHSLLAIDAARRDGFKIRSSLGEIDAEQAREALRRWTIPPHLLDKAA
ncbi:hypothetical protein [Sphingomonas sp. LM7]|uniref:hypothetical protein n=1 Tax=Sphingomonas sp. LM7 TaxID=1938607 RepID=UPI000983DA93|nr:hypothetical protein [Sphingomonas sp. LM7]AQR73830.1 hypothetical protein BXU08_09380 [Sphingomonas sp. LM7]